MDRLRETCEKRLSEFYRPKDRPWVLQRLRQELKAIQLYSQSEAFEQAQQVVQNLRSCGCNCRLVGAGGNSLVSFLLELSEIDPMKHGLPYERFLEANSSRTIQFQFVAHPKLDKIGIEYSLDTDNLSFGAASVQQATFVETIPCLVAEEIRRTDPGFDLTTIPLNERTSFKSIESGNNMETEAGQFLLDVKPRCLMDIAAFTAIQLGEVHESSLRKEFIRRKAKRNQGGSENCLVEQVLQETRGMILFQEQIMLIMNQVADIPLADAYRFIKDVCKKDWEQVATFREWFMVGAVGNGMNESVAHTLFGDIQERAATAVCKAHHLSEALTIYRTAFLKINFPREFSTTLQMIQQ